MVRELVDAAFVTDNEGVIPIVDVRPAFMYEEGHIPTAKNVDYIANDEADTLDTVFIQGFKDLGIEKDDPVILYCQTGMHAGLACEVLEEEGYDNIYYYRGSFDDWTMDPANPIEK